jgi:hypothetical protein
MGSSAAVTGDYGDETGYPSPVSGVISEDMRWDILRIPLAVIRTVIRQEIMAVTLPVVRPEMIPEMWTETCVIIRPDARLVVLRDACPPIPGIICQVISQVNSGDVSGDISRVARQGVSDGSEAAPTSGFRRWCYRFLRRWTVSTAAVAGRRMVPKSYCLATTSFLMMRSVLPSRVYSNT